MPPASLVVYPIDRSRATPLTALCLTDVMRNTLGVGPCQYLLDTEGLASQAPPTPDQVTRWVERQFRRKRAKRKAEQIAQRLEQMTEHVRRAQARMDQYAVLARKVRALCMSEEQRQPGSSAAVRELLSLTKHIERSIAATQETTKAPELAERLGGRIVALIGKENAFAECEKLGHQVRAVGGAQDKALSRCRMAVRRLKLACSTAQRPAAADLTTKVRGLADEVLARK